MRVVIVIVVLLLSSSSLAAGNFLSARQAFQVSVQWNPHQHAVIIDFDIAEGYYLYKDRLYVNASNSQIDLPQLQLPPADQQLQQQLQQKQHAVYQHSVRLLLPVATQLPQLIQEKSIPKKARSPFVVNLNYQGCAKAGLCYAPMRQQIHIDPILGKATLLQTSLQTSSQTSLQVGNKPLPSQSSVLGNKLLHNNLWQNLVLFFGLGILLSFTPCVLPMIPILSALITQQQKLTTINAFKLSLAYVLAMSFTYAVLGLLVGLVGQRWQASLQSPGMLSVCSGLLVLLALSLFGVYELQWPHPLRRYLAQLNQRQQGGTYLGVISMGVLSTLVISPCVSAPLVGALTYISQTGNALLGAMALLCLGLGMGLPLLVIGMSGGKYLPRSGAWMNGVKVFLGILLIAVAISLLGRFIFSAEILVLWAILLIGCVVFCDLLSQQARFFSRLKKVFAILLLIYAAILLFGASLGNLDPFNPLANLVDPKPTSMAEKSWTTVTSWQQLSNHLGKGDWVLVDFYADWCVSCRRMEAYTFTDPKVKQALQSLTLLRADVTQNNAEQQALQDHLQVIAPPTVVFFDPQGKERRELRIVGEVNANTLAKTLSEIY